LAISFAVVATTLVPVALEAEYSVLELAFVKRQHLLDSVVVVVTVVGLGTTRITKIAAVLELHLQAKKGFGRVVIRLVVTERASFRHRLWYLWYSW